MPEWKRPEEHVRPPYFPAYSWVLSLWPADWLAVGWLVVSRVCRVSRLSANARGPAVSWAPRVRAHEYQHRNAMRAMRTELMLFQDEYVVLLLHIKGLDIRTRSWARESKTGLKSLTSPITWTVWKCISWVLLLYKMERCYVYFFSINFGVR